MRLVDSYFAQGMAQLIENQQHIIPLSEQLLEVLDDQQGNKAVADLVKQWQVLGELQSCYQDYLTTVKSNTINSFPCSSVGMQTEQPAQVSMGSHAGAWEPGHSDTDISKTNQAQHTLRQTFDPFFDSLHTGLKQLDKIVRQHEKAKTEAEKAKGKRGATDRETKKLKEALELLHKEVKLSESYYQHIHWLQERFPKAEYEDVTGLCKSASQKEVKEQDYSLNPGRYVGVVIEEDGRTEEEFIDDLSNLNYKLNDLNSSAQKLTKVIQENIEKLVDTI